MPGSAINVWTLHKNDKLRALLLNLQKHLGDNVFREDDVRVDDPGAIWLCGVQDPEARVYLFTLGQDEDRYGLHLEYPTASDVHERLKMNSVVHILAIHFDVAVIQPRFEGDS